MVPSPVRGGLGDTPAVFSAVFSVQHIATYLYNYNLSRYPNTPFSDICYKCTETISLDLLFRLQALAPTIDPLIPHNVKLTRYQLVKRPIVLGNQIILNPYLIYSHEITLCGVSGSIVGATACSVNNTSSDSIFVQL